ncbi:MAG: hypothetical protein ACHQ51_06375 [Elusimicrobiota bacterium]
MRFSAVLAAALLFVMAGAVRAGPNVYPDRRRSQFSNDPGYAVLPYVYNLPGIGMGYGILGAATNVGGSYTDVVGTVFTGDANGQAFGVNAVHLIPRALILDFGGAHLSRTSIQSYSARGMASGKDDYSLAEFGNSYFLGSRLTATFDERRFEGFVGYYGGSARLDALRDRGGTVILTSQNAPAYRFSIWVLGGRLDLTDDYIDPRRGIRVEPSLWRAPRQGAGPDFYFTDVNLTGYVPVGKRSTWAFNYFRSDTHVLNKGETDTATLSRQQGLDCAAVTDDAKRAQCRRYLDAVAAQNSYGTASGLGGYQRLRSYPMERYKGAHAEFFGTELRWNLTDEVKPFDIYVMKDIRTAVQLALFYELGSVSDTFGGLWAIRRQSAGGGVRVVTASGLVYRLDLAGGDEGFQPSIFFQYPWEL